LKTVSEMNMTDFFLIRQANFLLGVFKQLNSARGIEVNILFVTFVKCLIVYRKANHRTKILFHVDEGAFDIIHIL